jgi:hypothetical protein
MTCKGCGVELPADSDPRRKWCSQACRVRQYSRPCKKCGTPMSGCNGHGPRAPLVCQTCQRVAAGAASHEASVLFRAELEALWAEGWTIAEIADRLEWKRTSMGPYIVRLRREGADLPYRHRISPAARRSLQVAGSEAAKRLHSRSAAGAC